MATGTESQQSDTQGILKHEGRKGGFDSRPCFSPNQSDMKTKLTSKEARLGYLIAIIDLAIITIYYL